MKSSVPFAEPTVPRDGPMHGTEPEVNFFTESTRPIAAAARATINGWYSGFSDPDGAFLKRLRSRNDGDHRVSLDELFVHQHLARYADIVYEEGGKGPDFRMYRGSEYLAGVEVLSLFTRKDWSDEQVRHDRIADELNRRVKLNRWFVHFEIVRLDQTPAAAALAAWVANTIDSLPANDTGQSGPFVPRHATYKAVGVHLEFDFIPREDKPVKPGDRIVGMGAMIGGMVNSRERLRVALGGKAGNRYDLREHPFAVFVVVHDSFCDLDDVEDALYGSGRISLPSLASFRGGDGFFGRSKGVPAGKNRRVSCLFVVMRWAPWAAGEATIFRLDNPFAERSLPDNLLPTDFRFTEVERNETSFRLDWVPQRPTGGMIAALAGMPDGWLVGSALRDLTEPSMQRPSAGVALIGSR